MDLIPGSVYEFDGDWILITNFELVGANVTVSSFVPKGSPFDFCWQIVPDAVIEEDFLPQRFRLVATGVGSRLCLPGR